jgi:hypothetical protein
MSTESIRTVESVHLLTTGDEAIAGYSAADFRRLSAAANSDRFGEHRLVESPHIADIILFVGSTYPDCRDVRTHPLFHRYREKCFLFHSGDYVLPVLPGVYVNMPRPWHSARTLSGPYLQMLHWDNVWHVPSLSNCIYLFSFIGSARTHAIRRRVIKLTHPRAYLKDTSAAIPLAEQSKAFCMVDYQAEAKMEYGKIISQSKFVLCPRGYACSTMRLFETMKAGRVPVIISDRWVAPDGPQWETFSLRVKENQTSLIPQILERYEGQAESMARKARLAWEEWFSNETVFHRIVEWCLVLQRRRYLQGFNDNLQDLHLLRPVFFRHVVLSEAKKAILNIKFPARGRNTPSITPTESPPEPQNSSVKPSNPLS